jgi:ABC-2 family transporter protein
MTVLTLPAQPGQDAGRAIRPVPWRRMVWVTWAQHRAMLIGLTAVLGAVAAFLFCMGLYVHHNFDALMACRPAASQACQALNSNFNSTDWTIANTLSILMNLAPALIGAFTGAAVMARELETGTFRYAWTQGIGRVRWTIAKLVLLGASIAILTWALSQVFTWFFAPILQQQDTLTVLSATVFDTRGIAFAAWCLMAFTVGVFLGMLLRRVVAAMAATLGVYLGLAVVTWLFLREHYPVALVTSNASLFNYALNRQRGADGGSFPSTTPNNSPWVLSTWNVGHTQWWRYIPVSRFWPMQLIEGGWLLVLSVILIAATVWLVRRRAA